MEIVFFFSYFTRHKQGQQIQNRAGPGQMHRGPASGYRVDHFTPKTYT